MGRKSILLFVLLAIVLFMVGAPIHEAGFDSDDSRPFPVDPDFLVMVLSSLLTMSLSVFLLAVPCFVLALALAGRTTVERRYAAISFLTAFDHKRRLFSPPGCLLSLRV
jgi:hypothetical protein